MTEPPFKGKQLVTKYKQSPLRQQVNPESTDDESTSECHSIQAADSQTAVSVSQFEHPVDDKTDGHCPFSPKTADTLGRTAVSKTTDAAKPFKIPGQLLKRPDEPSESTTTSETSVRFVFGQPPHVAKKPLLNAGRSAAQHEAGQGAPSVPPPVNLQDETPDGLLPDGLCEDKRHTRESQAPAPNTFNTFGTTREGGHSLDEPSGVSTDHPSSVQPSTYLVGGKKKTRLAKKGKKGKKGERRGAPWPPRPLGVVPVRTEPARTVEATSGGEINAHMASTLTVVQEDPSKSPSWSEADHEQDLNRRSRLPPQSITAVGPRPVHSSQHTQVLPLGDSRTSAVPLPATFVPHSVSYLPGGEDAMPKDSIEEPVHDVQLGTQDGNCTVQEPRQHMQNSDDMAQGQQNSLTGALHASPELRDRDDSDTPSHVPLDQSNLSHLPGFRDDAIFHRQEETEAYLPVELDSRKYTAPRPKAQYNSATHPRGSSEQVQETMEVGLQVSQADEDLAHGDDDQQHVSGNLAHSEHQQQAEAVLHGTSDLNGPCRVGKPKKKRRQQDHIASALNRNPDLIPQTEFDKALVMLSTAHRADQSRKDRDIATQAEHFKEVKALYQAQIDQLSATILDWKDKYAALSTTVSAFREKAKTNQKYVSGLQQDHEKLQKSVETIRDECKTKLKEKIAELEHEKQSLLSDFTTTLATLEKRQKNLKGTLDEVYTELGKSQLRRRGLARILELQVSMNEEEKNKRNYLKGCLLPSIQDLQHQLDDRSTLLIKNLDALQTSVDSVTSRQKTDASLQDCVKILREFQATPFLTSKDLEKSDGTLQSVHDGLCTKIEALAKSVESKTDSNENIQTFIGDQLQLLRSDMLKFDEVVSASRKNQDLSSALTTQLAAEREKAQEVDKRVENLSREVEELVEQKIQLERQLAEANDKFYDHSTEDAALQTEAGYIRRELGLIKGECCAAKAEIERLQKNIQKRDKQIDDYKASIQMLQDDNNKLIEEANRQMTPNPIELRREIEKDLEQEFSRKKSGYRNEIHRLNNELKERDDVILQHDKKMDAAKTRCEESKNASQNLQSQLDVTRQEKAEMEARLETLQRTTQSEPYQKSEMDRMEECLRQKTEELQVKSNEYTELERAHAELETNKRNLQVSWEQQQMEISQHSSLIDSLRQETEADRRKEQEQSKAALDVAQGQARTLEEEKSELQAKLTQAHVNESKLNETLAALSAERDVLHTHNAELKAAAEASASEVARAREEKASDVQKYEEQLDALQRHQERSEAALKEAEAKALLQKTEHHKKIEFDREKYESIIKTLTEKLGEMEAQATSRSHAQQKASEPASPEYPTLHLSQPIQTGKTRKRVSRENQTVLDVAGLSGTLVSASAPYTTRERSEGFDQIDNLFDEEHDSFDQMDKDQGCSIVDPAAVMVEDTQDTGEVLPPLVEDTQDVSGVPPPIVEETQDIGGMLPLFDDIATQAGQKLSDESSLSAPMTSDDLIQLVEDVHTPITNKHHRTQFPSQERIPETPVRPANASLSGSHSSQSYGRPRSRANTASRLMPPPGTVSPHFGQLKPSHAARSKNPSRQHNSNKIELGRGRSSDSSPDFGDDPFSWPKGSYDPRSPTENAGDPAEHGRSQKRKLDFDQDVSSKMQRTSSQSLSRRLSPGSRPYSPHHTQSKALPPSADRGLGKSQASPPFPSVSPPNRISGHSSGSSSNARHTSSQAPSNKLASKSRSHQSSHSRSSASSHAPRLYGRRQTRSKNHATDRFDEEIRGG